MEAPGAGLRTRPAAAGTLTSVCDHWEGLGATRYELQPGIVVMVPVGMGPAVVEGMPCVIAWAVVQRKATPEEAEAFREPDKMWWLEVWMGPGASLPQMYPSYQILGVPALGLTMAGAPAPR